MTFTLEDVRMDRKEAAKYLGLSESTLNGDAVKPRLKIPYVKNGRKCVYFKSQLDRWLSARMVNAVDETHGGGASDGPAATPPAQTPPAPRRRR